MNYSDEQVEQVIRQVTEQVLSTIQSGLNPAQAQNYEVNEPEFRGVKRSVIIQKIRLHMGKTKNVSFTPYEVADIIECGKLGKDTKDVYALRSILDTIAYEHKEVYIGKTRRTYYFFDNLFYEIK